MTDSIWCSVSVRCLAITQVKHLDVDTVLGWMNASLQPAHRNTECGVICSEAHFVP